MIKGILTALAFILNIPKMFAAWSKNRLKRRVAKLEQRNKELKVKISVDERQTDLYNRLEVKTQEVTDEEILEHFKNPDP